MNMIKKLPNRLKNSINNNNNNSSSSNPASDSSVGVEQNGGGSSHSHRRISFRRRQSSAAEEQLQQQQKKTTRRNSNSSITSSIQSHLSSSSVGGILASLRRNRSQEDSSNHEEDDCWSTSSTVIDDGDSTALTNLDEKYRKRPCSSRQTLRMSLSSPPPLLRQPSPQPPSSLSASLVQWLGSVDALLQSQELRSVVTSSVHVVAAASRLAVRTACLPVTVPLHVACTTTDLVLGGSFWIVQSTGALLEHVVMTVIMGNRDSIAEPPALLLEDEEEDAQADDDENLPPFEEKREEENVNASSMDDANSNVLNLPGAVLEVVAGKVKDEVGSIVLQAVAPSLVVEEPKKVVDYPPPTIGRQDNYLDRLRLDYVVPSSPACSDLSSDAGSPFTSTDKNNKTLDSMQSGDSSLMSNFLLRVDDLGLLEDSTQEPNKSTTLCYIDLEDFQSDPKLIERALSQLVASGISLLSNHPTVRLSSSSSRHHQPPTAPLSPITWSAEGSTSKLLKRMVKMTTLERLHALESGVLIWSGKMEPQQQQHQHHADNNNANNATTISFPFFLARGVIQRSPRDVLHLLWDNNRTSEYNNYCLGRTNLLVLDDNVLLGQSQQQQGGGTKAIVSETRVPFTNMSVKVNCMMHTRPLSGQDEGGYVIISRSLDSGVAGTHSTTATTRIQSSKQKNEILWGINILRRVPNHPHLTDLTSLSQVGTTLVPAFLASRIGKMGVEDFFRNVRSPKTTSSMSSSQEQQQESHPHFSRASTC